MKRIPECFQTTPIVYAVGKNYQIMVPVSKETLMWAEVGGKCYYDDVNGILRSNCTTHRMTVPMKEMDKAKVYKICYRIVNERKPYYSDVSDVFEYSSAFCPVQTDNPKFFQIADTHNMVEKPVAAAKAFGRIDFLILNGDLPDHSGDVKNFTTIHRIASEITDGEFPVVFARGNHDMRGIYAENIAEHTPTDNGRSYYTFRLGSLWGMVLDCGEDKPDGHVEYAHTICCADFRERQTEFIKNVILKAQKEYEADGIKQKIVIMHDPFTEYLQHQTSEADMKTYQEWASLLREYICPNVMICGHVHQAYVTGVGENLDNVGQPCPVVVGSAPGTRITLARRGVWVEDVYVGCGLEMDERMCTVTFIGNDAVIYEQKQLKGKMI